MVNDNKIISDLDENDSLKSNIPPSPIFQSSKILVRDREGIKQRKMNIMTNPSVEDLSNKSNGIRLEDDLFFSPLPRPSSTNILTRSLIQPPSSFPSLFTLTDMKKRPSSTNVTKMPSSLPFDDIYMMEEHLLMNKGDLYNLSNQISMPISPARRPYQSYFRMTNMTSETPKSKKRLCEGRNVVTPVTNDDIIKTGSKEDSKEASLSGQLHSPLKHEPLPISEHLFETFHINSLSQVQSILQNYYGAIKSTVDDTSLPTVLGAENSHLQEITRMTNCYKFLFPEWQCQLFLGFHLLFYGYGSKRRMMKQFCQQLLPHYKVLIVDGCHLELSVESVLNEWHHDMDMNLKECHTQKDHLNDIDSFKIDGKKLDRVDLLFQKLILLQEYKQAMSTKVPRSYLLVIFNMDGLFARQSQFVSFLSRLLRQLLHHPNLFRLMASLDHVYGPLLCSSEHFNRANWLFVDATQFIPYALEELSSVEDSLSGSLMSPSTSSLDAIITSSDHRALSSLSKDSMPTSLDAQQKLATLTVLANLTLNARKLFALLAKLQLQWFEAVIENQIKDIRKTLTKDPDEIIHEKENIGLETTTSQTCQSPIKKSVVSERTSQSIFNTPKKVLQSSFLLKSLSTPPRGGPEAMLSVPSPVGRSNLTPSSKKENVSALAMDYVGITFSQYYQIAKENFLVSNEMTFRTQLIEFFDHKIIASKRTILPMSTVTGNIGVNQGNMVEVLYIPFSYICIITIIESMEKL